MIKNCAVCGSELEENIKFCPKCGEKIPLAEEDRKAKIETKMKKQQTRFSLPKISLKNIPKPVLTGFVLICIAIIAIASIVIISPFDLSGSITNSGKNSIGTRVFAINVENTCDQSAKCYLTVGGLKYIQLGNNGEFTVTSGETLNVNIVEEAFFKKGDSYEISLYVEFDHLEKATVNDVTESVDFTICPLESEGEFSIECYSYR